MSLSSGDYSCLPDLAREMVKRYQEKRVKISLPSLRIDSYLTDTLKETQKVRKTALTLAPEAGSQRLRDVINKGVTEEDLMRSVKEAFENGRRILLHFEGAASYAVVSVNGKEVGSHKGGYTPFVFDITDEVNKGDNVVAVMLDSTERPEIPPFGNVVDYLVYGGIYREVWLEITERVYIENVFLYTLTFFK